MRTPKPRYMTKETKIDRLQELLGLALDTLEAYAEDSADLAHIRKEWDRLEGFSVEGGAA